MCVAPLLAANIGDPQLSGSCSAANAITEENCSSTQALGQSARQKVHMLPNLDLQARAGPVGPNKLTVPAS